MKPEQPFSELKAIAKAVKIESYLSQRGFQPERSTTEQLWYKSPLREKEDIPSFVVYLNENKWFDFGANGGDGSGDDVIKLCQELEHLSFPNAVRTLCGTEGNFMSFSLCEGFPDKERGRANKPKNQTKPDAVKEFTFNSWRQQQLRNYLNRRLIPDALIKRYLKFIEYNNRKYYGAGIRTDINTYEIITLSKKYPKIKLGNSYYTTIRTGRCKDIIIFESIIDSLSFLVWRKYHEFKTNAIILNSTSNTEKVLSCLGAYQKIFLFLDNDASGFNAAKIIQTAYPQAENWSAKLFPEYNDFNDFICKRPKY